MRLPILHHVYTSVSGYRTQYASPGIGRALPLLEDIAQRIYPRVGGRPMRGLVRVSLDGGPHSVGMAFFNAFPYQTDAYGRPRVCVHTIFIPPETVRSIAFLNPLAAIEAVVKTPFMGPKHSLDTVGGFLPNSVECPDADAQYANAVSLMRQPSGQGRVFLRALISGSITTVTLGQPDLVIRTLADLWPLLPPRVRHRFMYVRPFSAQPSLGPFGVPKLMMAGYAAEAPDAEELESQGYVVFDMVHRRVSENLPAESTYVAWLSAKAVEGGDVLRRTLSFLETRDPMAETAYFALNHLGQAVRCLANILNEDGTPDPTADPAAAAESLVPLCRAGMVSSAMEIVDALIRLAEKSPAVSHYARDVLTTARKALEKYNPEMERLLLPVREVIGHSAQQKEDITRLALPAVRRDARTPPRSDKTGESRK
jgi:hypothetical protein